MHKQMRRGLEGVREKSKIGRSEIEHGKGERDSRGMKTRLQVFSVSSAIFSLHFLTSIFSLCLLLFPATTGNCNPALKFRDRSALTHRVAFSAAAISMA
ncbi:hypothetical protein VNO77_20761 [Canavalia gladiata]|uniref:Transmembrane protein n=1 Tax=Canavalia gladiata TaxID=3824 RepID=A0AAN9QLI6_CANGL